MQQMQGAVRALILGLLVGCAQIPVGSNKPAAPQGEYVSGSVQVVSRRAQNMLQSFGLTVAATPEGEGMRLRCATANNGHFSLLLAQANAPEGERTQVRLEWEDGTDDTLGIRIMAGLGVLEGI